MKKQRNITETETWIELETFQRGVTHLVRKPITTQNRFSELMENTTRNRFGELMEDESDEEEEWQEPDDEEDPHHANIWGGSWQGFLGRSWASPQEELKTIESSMSLIKKMNRNKESPGAAKQLRRGAKQLAGAPRDPQEEQGKEEEREEELRKFGDEERMAVAGRGNGGGTPDGTAGGYAEAGIPGRHARGTGGIMPEEAQKAGDENEEQGGKIPAAP